MSQLIVDPRPERAHPLLQAEVQALRVQANCFRNGSEPVANSHRRGRTEPDTIPERLDEVPPGVRERLAKKRRGQKKASVQNQASSKNPRWAKSTRKRIPSTAALHAMVRAGYVVGQGYRGKEASELQTLLNRRGLQTEVTGIFDSQTERSLRSLQRQNGLDATGVLDAQSLAALEGRLV